MRFITTKQAALGSILLADVSDILLGRSANPLANIHTEVPSAAARLVGPPFLASRSVAFPSRPKLLILVSPPLCSAANSICGLVAVRRWIISKLYRRLTVIFGFTLGTFTLSFPRIFRARVSKVREKTNLTATNPLVVIIRGNQRFYIWRKRDENDGKSCVHEDLGVVNWCRYAISSFRTCLHRVDYYSFRHVRRFGWLTSY